ncbi:MAG: site-specific recombinase XerD [Crocinitomicaceae bacterium]|jgi:site-specific recombinase XerD
MNKLSFTIKFYLLRTREKNGTHPLYCRINVNRKKAEFSMHEFVDPKKWIEEAENVKGDPELSTKIHSTHIEIRKIRDKILEEDRVPTAKEIRDTFLRKEDKSVKLLDYVTSYTDQVDKLTEYSKSTWKKYQTVKRHLKAFLELNSISNIHMNRFNSVKVHEFELYLKTEARLSINTVTKYLKILKTIYNRAIQFGQTDKNPFDHFKFKHVRTNREFLTQDEINRLQEIKLPNESLTRVRDMFLFSTYTGLRFTDVDALTPKSIITDQHGKNWIEISTIQKTGDSHRTPLLDKAKVIVDKYHDEALVTGKLLPLRSNQKVNAYLKVVADLCGIEKHLTFHMARHSFATTITLSNDVPIEVVSQMLGHKDIATTQIYAKITNQYMQGHADKLNEIL